MPVVIALMGLPGSGKTTIAERLAQERGFFIVSRDAIRAAMFRPCDFAEPEKQSAYQALLLALASCLKLGRSCIVEGMTFSSASEVEDVRRVAQAARARFLPVLLDCPVAVAQARASRDIAAQSRAPADRNEHLVARVAERFEAPPEEITKAILTRLDRF